ncbi:MAG: fibronectin/fibrinogen-binding protein [Butyrivibrio sp.]|nr:fibronectin/fibrinogen-binding protein [Butyrivibrio sp.]
MAFDGITVASIVKELSDNLTGGRIYKIAQPESDEIVLTIKTNADKGYQSKVVLSADASLPLIYVSEESKKAPMTAPVFCMVLRKHILNGRITSITQPGLERIVRFEVEHMDEMGDMRHKVLLIELMGKYSNIIFIDEENKIIDSIKHISASVSSVREVLPGREYFVTQTQDKADPLNTDITEFASLIRGKGMPVFKAIYSSYTGLSSVCSQEICYRASIDADKSAIALTDAEFSNLYIAFSGLMSDVKQGTFKPTVAYIGGKPKEYAAFDLTIYSSAENSSIKNYDTMSQLLEGYYSEKNIETRIRQKSVDLRKIVQTALERNVRKLDQQTHQMQDTQKKDKYRVYGELLNVYGYSAKEGDKEITVEDYNTGKPLTIPLDPTLTASQNAKKYFDRYTKLKRTAEALEDQMKDVQEQIQHLESISSSLDIARQEEDLLQIRMELAEAGYVKKKSSEKGKRKEKITSKPFHYISSDGFDIYVGKNNYQNDELTFKVANGGDWWFHSKGCPGSHVVLITGGKDVPDRAFEEAAALAAYYSKGKDQDKVEIDYLQRKNVKKPGGAKPGFVVYYTNYSMVIAPDISNLKEIG